MRDRASDDDYFVSRVLGSAGRFVEEIGSAKPYCLWVESFSPHEFWDPPLRYADPYFQKDGLKNYIVPQLLNNVSAEAYARAAQTSGATPEHAAGEPASPDDIARTKALYQGYCTFCDERFGRFFRTLERTGALDDSVVVVLSDHGTELWDQGQFGKSGARMHPYNTHINLLIRHPEGNAAGTRTDAFVQNQDIMPTLLSLLGLPSQRLDGDDLWPLVTGRPGADELRARDHVVIGWEGYASVRDREWNLLVDTLDPTNEPRLYHLPGDPTELCNVASDHHAVVAKQIARLEALLGAPLPAVYQHRPVRGCSATSGGLRETRGGLAKPGERWVESNVV